MLASIGVVNSLLLFAAWRGKLAMVAAVAAALFINCLLFILFLVDKVGSYKYNCFNLGYEYRCSKTSLIGASSL